MMMKREKRDEVDKNQLKRCRSRQKVRKENGEIRHGRGGDKVLVCGENGTFFKCIKKSGKKIR